MAGRKLPLHAVLHICVLFAIVTGINNHNGKYPRPPYWMDNFKDDGATDKLSSDRKIPIVAEEQVPIKAEQLDDGKVGLEFKSHGRTHKLNLEETRQQFSDIPINIVGMDDESQLKVKDKLKNIKLMRDRATGAVASLEYDKSGQVKNLQKGVFRFGKYEFDFASGNTTSTQDSHVMVKKTEVQQTDLTRDRIKVAQSYGNATHRVRRATLEQLSVVVEVAMILDYSVWNHISTGSTMAADETDHAVSILLYFAHLGQIMDNHYASMKNDDIAITTHIAGITVIKDASQYSELTEDDKVMSGSKGYVDSAPTLDRIAAWRDTAAAKSLLPAHDHLMLFTRYNMYDTTTSEDSTVGLCYLGQICHDTQSTSLIEMSDVLTFDASTAAHELGHNLGADHDGVDGTSVSCADENYVMAAVGGSPNDLTNRFLFTCCSQRSFYMTIAQSTAACLTTQTSPTTKNYDASIDTKVDDKLPGESFNADDQCQIAKGTNACYGMEESICLALYCTDQSDPESCVSLYAGAADGTPCDDTAPNKICYQGACLDKSAVAEQLADQNCKVTDCYGTEMKCTSGFNDYTVALGSCYAKSSSCNGDNDCADGSDEAGCVKTPDCYLCDNNKCAASEDDCTNYCGGQASCKEHFESSATGLHPYRFKLIGFSLVSFAFMNLVCWFVSPCWVDVVCNDPTSNPTTGMMAAYQGHNEPPQTSATV